MADIFKGTRKDCTVGTKALQNIRGALTAFQRLQSVGFGDATIAGSLFVAGVIRYCKPFVQTKSKNGDGRYPWKLICSSDSVSERVHSELIQLRHTLIAHDDFTEIEPRVLFMSIVVQGSDSPIPMAVDLTNKCVIHPNSLETIAVIADHIKAVETAIAKQLELDVVELRNLVIENPRRLDDAPYNQKYGSFNVPKEGANQVLPNYSNDPWLIPNDPNTSLAEGNFDYENFHAKFEFRGPEVIRLPAGDIIEITPSMFDGRSKA